MQARTHGFFVPVARVRTWCYVVFGKELFRDCSDSTITPEQHTQALAHVRDDVRRRWASKTA